MEEAGVGPPQKKWDEENEKPDKHKQQLLQPSVLGRQQY